MSQAKEEQSVAGEGVPDRLNDISERHRKASHAGGYLDYGTSDEGDKCVGYIYEQGTGKRVAAMCDLYDTARGNLFANAWSDIEFLLSILPPSVRARAYSPSTLNDGLIALLNRYTQPCARDWDCNHSQCPLLRELWQLSIANTLQTANAPCNQSLTRRRKVRDVGDLMNLRLASPSVDEAARRATMKMYRSGHLNVRGLDQSAIIKEVAEIIATAMKGEQ